MHAFESLVASIQQKEGFWTTLNYKVELSIEEKRQIGRHSSPRWEIDVLAYKGATNELRVIECKSLLNSPGVPCDAIVDGTSKKAKRYKLFCDATLREVVLRRLERQLVDGGFCAPKPTITLCLAAGKWRGDESAQAALAAHFAKNGWTLLGPDYLRSKLTALRGSKYENTVEAFVVKLLLRRPTRASGRESPPSEFPD